MKMNLVFGYFKDVISTFSILSILVWFIKKIISDSFNKKYYKFSKLHEEQCVFIKKLYSDLYLLKSKYDELSFNSRENFEKYVDFRDQYFSEYVDLYKNVYLYYNSNKILLPRKTVVKIDELFKFIDKGIRSTSMAVLTRTSKSSEVSFDYEKYFRISDNLSTDLIPNSLNLLEVDFRNIFGLEE